MSQTAPTVELDPNDAAGWASVPFETLFTLSSEDAEGPQLEALIRQFERLRPGVAALDALATRQGVDRITSFEDGAPTLFDHRVYKSYPLSLIEKRQFERLTTWLGRLTMHDLTTIPMDDISSVDGWLDRLDEHGMVMTHSTGTTGKLSFFPDRRASGRDGTTRSSRAREPRPALTAARRRCRASTRGIAPVTRPGRRCRRSSAPSRPRARRAGTVSTSTTARPICSRSPARLRDAEERGELDKLDIDPRILQERAQLIEEGRNRDRDLERWFNELAAEHRGQRVRITGVTADLIQLALKGRERGQVRVRARLGAVHERRHEGVQGRPRRLGAGAQGLLSASSACRASTR